MIRPFYSGFIPASYLLTLVGQAGIEPAMRRLIDFVKHELRFLLYLMTTPAMACALLLSFLCCCDSHRNRKNFTLVFIVFWSIVENTH